MIVDIIDTEYFQKTKLKNIIRKVVLVLSPCILLFLVTNWFFFSLEDYSVYRDILIIILLPLLFFNSLFDSSLFTRIGTIEFSENELIINNQDIVDRIDLTNVNEIKLRRVNYEFYLFTIKQHSIVIELNEYTMIKFKNILKKYTIKKN